MRHSLPFLLLLACVALPVQAQTCKKVAPPFLPSLLPERVAGMPLEFATDPGGGCMSLYRPEDSAARVNSMWAVVTLEANTDEVVGESGESIRKKFTPPDYSVVSMSEWPIVFRELLKGDEYVAFMGSVKVTVLVKNGDHGTASAALASRFFEAILPKVPCG